MEMFNTKTANSTTQRKKWRMFPQIRELWFNDKFIGRFYEGHKDRPIKFVEE